MGKTSDKVQQKSSIESVGLSAYRIVELIASLVEHLDICLVDICNDGYRFDLARTSEFELDVMRDNALEMREDFEKLWLHRYELSKAADDQLIANKFGMASPAPVTIKSRAFAGWRGPYDTYVGAAIFAADAWIGVVSEQLNDPEWRVPPRYMFDDIDEDYDWKSSSTEFPLDEATFAENARSIILALAESFYDFEKREKEWEQLNFLALSVVKETQRALGRVPSFWLTSADRLPDSRRLAPTTKHAISLFRKGFDNQVVVERTHLSAANVAKIKSRYVSKS